MYIILHIRYFIKWNVLIMNDITLIDLTSTIIYVPEISFKTKNFNFEG